MTTRNWQAIVVTGEKDSPRVSLARVVRWILPKYDKRRFLIAPADALLVHSDGIIGTAGDELSVRYVAPGSDAETVRTLTDEAVADYREAMERIKEEWEAEKLRRSKPCSRWCVDPSHQAAGFCPG